MPAPRRRGSRNVDHAVAGLLPVPAGVVHLVELVGHAVGHRLAARLVRSWASSGIGSSSVAGRSACRDGAASKSASHAKRRTPRRLQRKVGAPGLVVLAVRLDQCLFRPLDGGTVGQPLVRAARAAAVLAPGVLRRERQVGGKRGANGVEIGQVARGRRGGRGRELRPVRPVVLDLFEAALDERSRRSSVQGPSGSRCRPRNRMEPRTCCAARSRDVRSSARPAGCCAR